PYRGKQTVPQQARARLPDGYTGEALWHNSAPDWGSRRRGRGKSRLNHATSGHWSQGYLLSRIFIPQARLPASHRNRYARDVDLLHIRLDVEWISVCHNHVCDLAHVE